MREYGKIHSSFWTSETIRALSENGRTLAAYLLTSPHSNMIGCFRLPKAYACEDLKWSSETVSEGFADLSRNGFATFDEQSGWVIIQKFLKWNPFENGNVGKAAAKLFDQTPGACKLKGILAARLREYGGKHFNMGFLNGFETVPQTVPEDLSEQSGNGIETVSEGFQRPFRNPEPEPEPNQNLNPLSGQPDDADADCAEEREPELELEAEDPVAEIIGHLNGKAGTHFRVVEASAKLIRARLREGATLDDLRAVVDAKNREWPKGHDMRRYLRPATLFNAEKFEQYRGQIGADASPGGDETTRGLVL